MNHRDVHGQNLVVWREQLFLLLTNLSYYVGVRFKLLRLPKYNISVFQLMENGRLGPTGRNVPRRVMEVPGTGVVSAQFQSLVGKIARDIKLTFRSVG